MNGKNSFLVKARGSDRWIHMAPETKPTATIEAGWTSRVSDVKNGVKTINLKWIPKDKVFAHINEKGIIKFRPTTNPRIQLVWENRSLEKIPSSARKFEVIFQNQKIKGSINKNTGEIYISKTDLPPAFKNDLTKLSDALKKDDFVALKDLASGNGNKTIIYNSGKVNYTNNSRLVDNLKLERYNQIAKQVVDDPVAMARKIDLHKKTEIKSVNEWIKNGQLEKASHKTDVLIETYGKTSQFNPLKVKIDNLKQIQKINQSNKDITILSIERTPEGHFRVFNGKSFSKPYKANDLSSLADDIIKNSAGEGNSSVYFDFPAGKSIKADGFISSMRIQIGAKNPKLAIRRSPKGAKGKTSYFGAKVKGANKFDITKSANGNFIGKQKHIVSVKGRAKEIAIEFSAKTKALVQEFFALVEKLLKNPRFKSRKLPDIINKARKELKRRHPQLKDKDFQIKFHDEFGSNHIVYLLPKGFDNAA